MCGGDQVNSKDAGEAMVFVMIVVVTVMAKMTMLMKVIAKGV